jgi:hypothetical protein
MVGAGGREISAGFDVVVLRIAFAREVERRTPGIATAKWWKEERSGVFLCFARHCSCGFEAAQPLMTSPIASTLPAIRRVTRRRGTPAQVQVLPTISS